MRPICKIQINEGHIEKTCYHKQEQAITFTLAQEYKPQ